MKKNFNIIRVIGVYGIVLYHLNEINFVWDGFYMFSVCVFACLALTGFLFGYFYIDKKIDKKYVLSKLAKFYPFHCIGFLFSLIYLALLKINFSFETILLALTNLSLLQSFIPFQKYFFSYNGVSWYLSVTMFFYLLSPLFAKINKNRKIFELSLISVIICSLSILFLVLCENLDIQDELYVWLTYINPILNCLFFYLSMCIGQIVRNSEKRTIIFVSLLCVVFAYILDFVTFGYLYQIKYTLCTVACLALLSIDNNVTNFLFGNRIVSFLSKHSLAVYLFHQPIANILKYEFYIHGFYNNFLCFISSVVIIFVISISIDFIYQSIINNFFRKNNYLV